MVAQLTRLRIDSEVSVRSGDSKTSNESLVRARIETAERPGYLSDKLGLGLRQTDLTAHSKSKAKIPIRGESYATIRMRFSKIDLVILSFWHFDRPGVNNL